MAEMVASDGSMALVSRWLCRISRSQSLETFRADGQVDDTVQRCFEKNYNAEEVLQSKLHRTCRGQCTLRVSLTRHSATAA